MYGYQEIQVTMELATNIDDMINYGILIKI